MMKRLMFLVVLAAVLYGHHADAVCGYKACKPTKNNMINVHLVPHSHDDVGWLKTVDQYYYGSRNNIQHAGVQYILDSVVQQLLLDDKRTFMYVETEFFRKWFEKLDPPMQTKVKKLNSDGRLEFAGGALSMNDEAASHYQSVIDQFAVGLKYLSDTFGVCGRPRVGWQIDPFGHSREMASMFAQMGFDGEFFARTDWVQKSVLLNNLTAEMRWQASESLPPQTSELFTGLLYHHYSAPPGFCFDTLCSDAPIIDEDGSYDNNVKERVDEFIAYINKMHNSYRSMHLLVPMGDDFNYENAVMNFKNMDKLIKYVNARQIQGSKVNVLYSTPSCYLNSLHELLQTWPNKTQDFFPYSTDPHTWWTGYYTSRPTQKRFERDGNHLSQVARQLSVLANLTDAATTKNLDKLREVMGVMQHHDAITGTEKQHVACDYDRMLHDGMLAGVRASRQALQKLTNLTTGEFESCFLLNISSCAFTQNSAHNLVVTLYNPVAHTRTEYVRIPVKNENHIVYDATGREVRSQLVPVPKEVLALPFRNNLTQHELVFAASVDKIANYYVKVVPKPRAAPFKEQKGIRIPDRFQNLPRPQHENEIDGRAPGDIIVQNTHVKLTFDSSGHLTNVQANGINENIRQEFYYYKGAYGNNGEFKNRSSGAYIFRPNGTEILIGPKVTLTVHEGTLVKEVHQKFNDWVSQVVRIYEGRDDVEFEWLVGPIPIDDGFGKEIITRFSSSLNNRNVFYTDSNGREMIKRVLNEREDFKPNLTEKVSGNYYPITARIAIENDQRRIALLNDRAQGGSSLKPGQLELMLHRRLLRDDAFGVGEALNETAYGRGLVARGKVHLYLDSLKFRPSIQERFAQLHLHLPFYAFFSNSSRAISKVVPKIPSFDYLPQAVNILTLEPFTNTERLLRLEYIMDKTESSTVSLNLRQLFDSLGGEEITEYTLDGSMLLSDMKRFKFQPDGTKPTKVEYYTSKHTPLVAKKKDATSKFAITMDPMQIRTFRIKWK